MNKHKKSLITIGSLLAASTACIAIINKVTSTTAVIKDLLGEKNGSYYPWKFGNIYYTKTGRGKPLLFIHDLNVMSSDQEWSLIVDSLKNEYTIYTIDLLGCGRSDKPEITYTNFMYVQLVTDFIRNVIGVKTNIIATGLSSSIAIMSCLNDAELINKMLFISPEDLAVLNQIPCKHSKTAKFLMELPVLGSLLYHITTCKSNVELAFTEKYLFNPFSLNKRLVDTYYEAAHLNGTKGRFLQGSIVGHYIYTNVARGLKIINNSIFIIAGEGSKNVNETIALYQSLNSSIEYELIPKTNQLPQIENPEKVLEIIRYYFS